IFYFSLLLTQPPLRSTLFPYTTLFRSAVYEDFFEDVTVKDYTFKRSFKMSEVIYITYNNEKFTSFLNGMFTDYTELFSRMVEMKDRKSTRLNSSHVKISYAVFCLKKKN